MLNWTSSTMDEYQHSQASSKCWVKGIWQSITVLIEHSFCHPSNWRRCTFSTEELIGNKLWHNMDGTQTIYCILWWTCCYGNYCNQPGTFQRVRGWEKPFVPSGPFGWRMTVTFGQSSLMLFRRLIRCSGRWVLLKWEDEEPLINCLQQKYISMHYWFTKKSF